MACPRTQLDFLLAQNAIIPWLPQAAHPRCMILAKLLSEQGWVVQMDTATVVILGVALPHNIICVALRLPDGSVYGPSGEAQHADIVARACTREGKIQDFSVKKPWRALPANPGVSLFPIPSEGEVARSVLHGRALLQAFHLGLETPMPIVHKTGVRL